MPLNFLRPLIPGGLVKSIRVFDPGFALDPGNPVELDRHCLHGDSRDAGTQGCHVHRQQSAVMKRLFK
jgi:hypothetical protein